MVDEKWRTFLFLGLLATGSLLLWAASEQLSIQAKRADTATSLAEVSAWQVSQVLEEVRRITREAAARQVRGEIP